jgi:trk system potassium uptake protein TrkA
MESVIIGGGKIGYNLLKILREKNYQVILIERDRETCLKISDELDTEVICGDGTDLEVLQDAGIGDAEIVAAVTGTDEENLVICQIAKVNFHIRKTIARVNNPKNISMFRALGIDRIVCSTEVIANMMEYELDRGDCRVVRTLEPGGMLLAELLVTHTGPWANRKVRDLRLPAECVITSILRGDRIIFPRGDTEIAENDRVLFVTNRPGFDRVLEKLKQKEMNDEDS